jgi:hypothetical protein
MSSVEAQAGSGWKAAAASSGRSSASPATGQIRPTASGARGEEEEPEGRGEPGDEGSADRPEEIRGMKIFLSNFWVGHGPPAHPLRPSMPGRETISIQPF